MTKDISLVVFSDLHLEKYKNFNEGNRRVKNGIDVLRKIAYITKKYKAISVFTGDLYHKEQGITNELLEATLPFLGKIWRSGEFKTIAITGNHDQSTANSINKQSPSYIRTLSKTFKGLECIDFESREVGNMVLHGIPYITHDIGLIDYINSMRIVKDKKNVLLLHTTMPNAKDTDDREIHSNLSTDAFYQALEKFDMVLCGHIHKPFTMKKNGVRIIQVGAPQQQRFTDRNCDMGYWLIYSDLTYKFVPFKEYPKFIEIESIQDKIEDGNFYVVKPKIKEKLNEKVKEVRNFNDTTDKNTLAKNYCREKGIKDSKKKKALSNSLKNTE